MGYNNNSKGTNRIKLITEHCNRLIHRACFLGFACALVFSLSGTSLAKEVSEAQLEQLKQNIAKIDRWLDQANTEKSGLSKQLRNQEKKIAEVSREVRTTNTKINHALKELNGLQKQQKQQTESLNTQKEYLIKQLRSVYEQGKQPAIKMLLDSDNPQNTARYLNYFAYINEARSDKIKTFKQTLDKLDKTKQSILIQKKKLNQHREELETHHQSLVSSQKSRQKVLAKLERSIKSESSRLKKLKADQTRLQELLAEVERAIANLELPSDAAPFSQQKNKLPWPARGKVKQRFGSRLAQGKLKSNGINIALKEDQAINAVHSGRVVFSDWIRGFGLLMIIDHGEGFMSLYGNNKSLIKETGDWVRAQETIAYAIDSSGKNESGLYFEIRRHGKPLNPRHWLRK